MDALSVSTTGNYLRQPEDDDVSYFWRANLMKKNYKKNN